MCRYVYLVNGQIDENLRIASKCFGGLLAPVIDFVIYHIRRCHSLDQAKWTTIPRIIDSEKNWQNVVHGFPYRIGMSRLKACDTKKEYFSALFVRCLHQESTKLSTVPPLDEQQYVASITRYLSELEGLQFGPDESEPETESQDVNMDIDIERDHAKQIIINAFYSHSSQSLLSEFKKSLAFKSSVEEFRAVIPSVMEAVIRASQVAGNDDQNEDKADPDENNAVNVSGRSATNSPGSENIMDCTLSILQFDEVYLAKFKGSRKLYPAFKNDDDNIITFSDQGDTETYPIRHTQNLLQNEELRKFVTKMSKQDRSKIKDQLIELSSKIENDNVVNILREIIERYFPH